MLQAQIFLMDFSELQATKFHQALKFFLLIMKYKDDLYEGGQKILQANQYFSITTSPDHFLVQHT